MVSWIDIIAAPVWIILSLVLISIIIKIAKVIGWRNVTFYWLIGLFVFIWLHPFYTSVIKGYAIVEIGNIASLILSVLVFYKLKVQFKNLANWLIPQIIWLIIASIYIGLKLVFL
jgi:hypothetical protein